MDYPLKNKYNYDEKINKNKLKQNKILKSKEKKQNKNRTK